MSVKIGLKLYSTNSCYLRQAQELYDDGMYQFIELLSVPESYEDTKKLWKNFKVPYVIHAPHISFEFNLSKREREPFNMKLADEARRFADALNAQYIIFHAGTEGELSETVRQLNMIDDSRKLVENKPYTTIDGVRRCIGGTAEDIGFILKNTNAGFCFDIGHAISYSHNISRNWQESLKQFVKLAPAMFHVSDGFLNTGKDTHDHIGTGDFEWGKILPMFSSEALVTMETKKDSRTSLEDFVQDVKAFRSLEADQAG